MAETAQERYIQEVTNDVVENQMKLDFEGSDRELQEFKIVDNLKLVDVTYMLEQIITM